MLQTQCSRELDLGQTGHEIAEKSSKIVPLAALPAPVVPVNDFHKHLVVSFELCSHDTPDHMTSSFT